MMNKPPCGLARSLCHAFNIPTKRSIATQRPRIQIPASFPVTEQCPPSTCTCRSMPTGLDIDHELSLNGTMAAYSEHILISTGRNDWKSKIEDDEDAQLVNQLKKLLTRGGKYSDPFHNVMVTNSSLPKSSGDTATAEAFLLPSFRHIPDIPTDSASVERLIKAFVLPTTPHKSHELLSEDQRAALIRDSSLQPTFPIVRDVDEILVLICGHGGRDDRCGILGPLLQDEFADQMRQAGFRVIDTQSGTSNGTNDTSVLPPVRIGQISHIGGHKFAGNAIIYLPPKFASNSLAGKGIWYGRVTPQHVQGIIQETIQGGKVIRELFRGGIEQDGKIMRL